MYANPEFQLFVGPVGYLETEDGAEKFKRHGADLPRVLDSVSDGQTTRHHIGVPDCLHLTTKEIAFLITSPA